jgi:multiple sugar transport system permease protein/sn-glycerol 3-phosphate transport system permease protein
MILKGNGEIDMKDTLLLRMRQTGWFDVWLFALAIAIVTLVIGAAGVIQYNVQMGNMPAHFNEYQINEALGSLAHARQSFLLIGRIALLVSAVGFTILAITESLAPKVSRKNKDRLKMVGVGIQYLAAGAVTLVMLFPIYWMVISSLKTSTELLLPVPTLWPHQFQWSNFPNVLERAPFVRYLFNTLVSTFFIMVGEVVIGVFAAYGFSKGQFKGRDFLFMLVLGALMVPIQVTFVPIYVMISRMGWVNSFPGLIVPNLVSAYFIFMLRQAFMSVDDSYLDAGRVDGLGRIGTIVHVLAPMNAPTLITISIITFINGWNSYFWPKMVATKDEYRTIAVGVVRLRRTFSGMETANYNEIMAGAVMAIIPIVLLFLILQKYIMTGMSKAAMK